MSIEAMKQALEALEDMAEFSSSRLEKQITALRQAIEQAEKQEPVAYPENFIDALRYDTALRDFEHEQAQKQEPVTTLDELEQEIYGNTRQFVSRDVMEWMLKRYYTSPPQRQPEKAQEPVAWFHTKTQQVFVNEPPRILKVQCEPLYTSPPQRQWVGLNWDDLPEIYVGDVAFTHGAKWAEAKLKEKNT